MESEKKNPETNGTVRLARLEEQISAAPFECFFRRVGSVNSDIVGCQPWLTKCTSGKEQRGK